MQRERSVLEDTIVRKVLGAALSTGGEWAEIYAEDRLSHSIRLEDRRVEELVTGRDRGAGVRVVRGTSSAYAYTNRLDSDSLLEAARVAAAALREQPVAEVRDLRPRTPRTRCGAPTTPPAPTTPRWSRSSRATATPASGC